MASPIIILENVYVPISIFHDRSQGSMVKERLCIGERGAEMELRDGRKVTPHLGLFFVF